MLPLIVLVILAGIVLLPQFWVKRVTKKYSQTIDDLPGTGGELAEHLVSRFELTGVTVEQTGRDNDHYDPESKAIRLAESNYEGKSLTAVTIAAHEFGHALQHYTNYQPLLLRTKLAKVAGVVEKIASFILVSAPFTLLLKIPLASAVMILAGLTMMCLPIILHAITLPVEFDASFKRALPLLKAGEYLPDSALPVAHKILQAAALTYLSASLASLLNFYRWWAILRR